MSQILFKAIPTEVARSYQAGVQDDNGQLPEQHVSDGAGVPCRHCLREVPAGRPYLILGYRPFPVAQPYAELGPIFLCAEKCERHEESQTVPQLFQSWNELLIRAYNSENRIIYGTGQVVATEEIPHISEKLFEDDAVDFIHLRSASNNCFQCRIERVSR